MRRTRLVILPGARCLTQMCALLLYLSCPNIGALCREHLDISRDDLYSETFLQVDGNTDLPKEGEDMCFLADSRISCGKKMAENHNETYDACFEKLPHRVTIKLSSTETFSDGDQRTKVIENETTVKSIYNHENAQNRLVAKHVLIENTDRKTSNDIENIRNHRQSPEIQRNEYYSSRRLSNEIKSKTSTRELRRDSFNEYAGRRLNLDTRIIRQGITKQKSEGRRIELTTNRRLQGRVDRTTSINNNRYIKSSEEKRPLGNDQPSNQRDRTDRNRQSQVNFRTTSYQDSARRTNLLETRRSNSQNENRRQITFERSIDGRQGEKVIDRRIDGQNESRRPLSTRSNERIRILNREEGNTVTRRRVIKTENHRNIENFNDGKLLSTRSSAVRDVRNNINDNQIRREYDSRKITFRRIERRNIFNTDRIIRESNVRSDFSENNVRKQNHDDHRSSVENNEPRIRMNFSLNRKSTDHANKDRRRPLNSIRQKNSIAVRRNTNGNDSRRVSIDDDNNNRYFRTSIHRQQRFPRENKEIQQELIVRQTPLRDYQINSIAENRINREKREISHVKVADLNGRTKTLQTENFRRDNEFRRNLVEKEAPKHTSIWRTKTLIQTDENRRKDRVFNRPNTGTDNRRSLSRNSLEREVHQTITKELKEQRYNTKENEARQREVHGGRNHRDEKLNQNIRQNLVERNNRYRTRSLSNLRFSTDSGNRREINTDRSFGLRYIENNTNRRSLGVNNRRFNSEPDLRNFIENTKIQNFVRQEHRDRNRDRNYDSKLQVKNSRRISNNRRIEDEIAESRRRSDRASEHRDFKNFRRQLKGERDDIRRNKEERLLNQGNSVVIENRRLSQKFRSAAQLGSETNLDNQRDRRQNDRRFNISPENKSQHRILKNDENRRNVRNGIVLRNTRRELDVNKSERENLLRIARKRESRQPLDERMSVNERNRRRDERMVRDSAIKYKIVENDIERKTDVLENRRLNRDIGINSRKIKMTLRQERSTVRDKMFDLSRQNIERYSHRLNNRLDNRKINRDEIRRTGNDRKLDRHDNRLNNDENLRSFDENLRLLANENSHIRRKSATREFLRISHASSIVSGNRRVKDVGRSILEKSLDQPSNERHIEEKQFQERESRRISVARNTRRMQFDRFDADKMNGDSEIRQRSPRRDRRSSTDHLERRVQNNNSRLSSRNMFDVQRFTNNFSTDRRMAERGNRRISQILTSEQGRTENDISFSHQHDTRSNRNQRHTVETIRDHQITEYPKNGIFVRTNKRITDQEQANNRRVIQASRNLLHESRQSRKNFERVRQGNRLTIERQTEKRIVKPHEQSGKIYQPRVLVIKKVEESRRVGGRIENRELSRREQNIHHMKRIFEVSKEDLIKKQNNDKHDTKQRNTDGRLTRNTRYYRILSNQNAALSSEVNRFATKERLENKYIRKSNNEEYSGDVVLRNIRNLNGNKNNRLSRSASNVNVVSFQKLEDHFYATNNFNHNATIEDSLTKGEKIDFFSESQKYLDANMNDADNNEKKPIYNTFAVKELVYTLFEGYYSKDSYDTDNQKPLLEMIREIFSSVWSMKMESKTSLVGGVACLLLVSNVK